MGKWTIDDVNPNDVIIIAFKNEIAETLKSLIPELEVIVYPESYAGDKENLKKVFINKLAKPRTFRFEGCQPAYIST